MIIEIYNKKTGSYVAKCTSPEEALKKLNIKYKTVPKRFYEHLDGIQQSFKGYIFITRVNKNILKIKNKVKRLIEVASQLKVKLNYKYIKSKRLAEQEIIINELEKLLNELKIKYGTL